MQPHFIYNVLGSIQELVLLDPRYASEVLGDFTVYLRSCVRAIASDEPIHFTEELNNIQAYVNIEKMRFGNKLNVQYKIQTEDFHILPLSIQPLVENAIRHGIYKKGNAGGTVTICTSEKDNWIEIRVIDDGVGFDENKMLRDIKKGRRDSTGLGNIRFRLEKVMGARIQMKSEIGKGTTVTIRLPRRE
jgi:sensor histidine kinase YesM